MGGRGSLARQLLAWQLVVVVALLCAVGALSVVQAGANFTTTEGRRMLSVAEDVAATAGVRVALDDPLRHYLCYRPFFHASYPRTTPQTRPRGAWPEPARCRAHHEDTRGTAAGP